MSTISRLAIGFVTDGMSGPGSGAWSRFAAQLKLLRSLGHSTYVLCDPALFEPVASLATRADRLPAHGRVRRFARRQQDAQDFSDRHALDVVHLETPPFVRLLRTKVVATVLDLRGLDSTSRTAWSTETLYQRLALRRQLEGVDAVQTISLWMAEQVSLRLNVARERIHLTYPIAEAPLHRILPGPQGNFALALGHLEPRKNLEVLVDATADADWPKGFPLLVAGRDAGSQRNLEDRSSQLKAPVHLLGAVSDASRGQLLSTATVVLVPSVYEGFGMVPIEAVLAGRPALVSDRGPLPEVVGVQESVLPAHDAHAWATKVREIHASPHVARALHQRQLAAARRFSREAVAGQLNALYAAVCSQE